MTVRFKIQRGRRIKTSSTWISNDNGRRLEYFLRFVSCLFFKLSDRRFFSGFTLVNEPYSRLVGQQLVRSQLMLRTCREFWEYTD